MRSAHVSVSARSDGGGVSVAMLGLANALARNGSPVEVHAQESDATPIDGFKLPLSIHPNSTRFPFPRSSSLRDSLSQSTAKLFHSHGLWTYPSIAVPQASSRTGNPWIVSPHGMLDEWALRQSRWKKKIASIAFERRHLSGAACIHALCDAEADSMHRFGLRNPVCVVPNGVPLPGISDTEKSRKQNLPNILLFVGRLHPKKGLANAIRAWADTSASKRENWKFIIAGWDQGGHADQLRRLASELHLSWTNSKQDSSFSRLAEYEIIFRGPVFGDEKDQLLRSASAFILPSFSEGLPVAVLEAWSYHLPVLITPECNLPEGYTSGSAIQIQTDDESIRQGLQDLMSMSDRDRQNIGSHGRALVERKFTWDVIASEMNKIYQWVCGEGSIPSALYTV